MNEDIVTIHKTSALLVRMEPDTKRRLFKAARAAKRPATIIVRELIHGWLKGK